PGNTGGQQGNRISAYDAAYSLVALAIYQRAQDALPVGYASGGQADGRLHSPQGKQALELIRHQADFILAQLLADNGLVRDGRILGGPLDPGQSLDSQFAVIRGLAAAFTATGDSKYRVAARRLYQTVDARLYDARVGTWTAQPG